MLTRKKTAAASRMPGRSVGSEVGSRRARAARRSAARARRRRAATVIAYWHALKSSLMGALRRDASASTLAPTERHEAHAGPATSIAANANVVEVVTSPSAPRVTTFSGTKLADEARRAKKTSTSGGAETARRAPSTDEDHLRHSRADRDDGGDVAWSGGSLSRVAHGLKQKRVPCPLSRLVAAHGTLWTTTYGRCGPSWLPSSFE